MIVRVPDLSSEVRDVEFREPSSALNAVLASGPLAEQQRFDDDVAVRGEVYRHGTDVYFNGAVSGTVTYTCPRCLDEFSSPLARDFRFLIVKAAPGQPIDDDAGLDHYEGDELDLGRLAREQALLALDPSVLCSEQCRGLCAGCGASLNREPCVCRPSA